MANDRVRLIIVPEKTMDQAKTLQVGLHFAEPLPVLDFVQYTSFQQNPPGLEKHSKAAR